MPRTLALPYQEIPAASRWRTLRGRTRSANRTVILTPVVRQIDDCYHFSSALTLRFRRVRQFLVCKSLATHIGAGQSTIASSNDPRLSTSRTSLPAFHDLWILLRDVMTVEATFALLSKKNNLYSKHRSLAETYWCVLRCIMLPTSN